MNSCLIEINDLKKSFILKQVTIEVLKGINLKINSGDMISIVGKSGVGKSTFLQIIGTLDKPSSGTIKFDNVDLFNLSDKNQANFRNREIGFVFQFHHLLPEFTVLENTAMPAFINKINKKKAYSKAKELLSLVGLNDRIHHLTGEISGGEQQRVALARAMVMNPRLILADEPTGNLDTDTAVKMQELLLDLNKQFNTTVIVVTHDERFADLMPRKLRMSDGLFLE